MTATNHVVTGAAIGALVVNPWVALPLALASHFALDALPHFDYPEKNFQSQKFLVWLAADTGLAGGILVTLWFLQPANVLLIVSCGMVAALPDTMWAYYSMFKRFPNNKLPHWLPRFHAKIQRWDSPKYWPLELLWFAFVLSILVSQLQLTG